jgi:hypothetical protein
VRRRLEYLRIYLGTSSSLQLNVYYLSSYQKHHRDAHRLDFGCKDITKKSPISFSWRWAESISESSETFLRKKNPFGKSNGNFYANSSASFCLNASASLKNFFSFGQVSIGLDK